MILSALTNLNLLTNLGLHSGLFKTSGEFMQQLMVLRHRITAYVPFKYEVPSDTSLSGPGVMGES